LPPISFRFALECRHPTQQKTTSRLNRTAQMSDTTKFRLTSAPRTSVLYCYFAATKVRSIHSWLLDPQKAPLNHFPST
jgi:hypothetical protein